MWEEHQRHVHGAANRINVTVRERDWLKQGCLSRSLPFSVISASSTVLSFYLFPFIHPLYLSFVPGFLLSLFFSISFLESFSSLTLKADFLIKKKSQKCEKTSFACHLIVSSINSLEKLFQAVEHFLTFRTRLLLDLVRFATRISRTSAAVCQNMLHTTGVVFSFCGQLW